MDYILYIKTAWPFFYVPTCVFCASHGIGRRCGFNLAFMMSLIFTPILGILFVTSSEKKLDFIQKSIIYLEAGIMNKEDYKKCLLIGSKKTNMKQAMAYIVVANMVLIVINNFWMFTK